MITIINGNKLEKGQQIQVYRNLRKDNFSIRDAKTRRVIAYGTDIILSNIRMCVQKGGRKRVIREKWKNIHAFVSGTYEGNNYVNINQDWEVVYYNPYTTETFINTTTGEPIFRANVAYLSNGKCFVKIGDNVKSMRKI
ncbi:hypothetical protein [Lysinibacillus boronitolerans]|uniref:hypothetical protein n=1 Tax=Lysinibacillus boronitolerans TaxID=309788 RepID=UPI00289C7F44|nr:hypothetical protein [Bacillus mobilis]